MTHLRFAPHPNRVALAALAVACRWAALVAGLMVPALRAQEPGKPKPEAGTVVHYVSETPYRWEGGNPLEVIARVLSNRWAAEAPNGDKLPSIQRQLNIMSLREAARYGRAEPRRNANSERQRQAFAIHGWEYCFFRPSAGFDALLVAAKGGKPAMAEFVVLCRKGEYKGEGLEFHWSRLADKEILVDRGNCGELAHFWIDTQTYLATGAKGMTLAPLRNAESAEGAILSVYFREVEACVVTRESYEDVIKHNQGLATKLEVVCNSAPMLRYVVTTSEASMASIPGTSHLELRKQYVSTAAELQLDMPGAKWTLIPARSEYFASVEEFSHLYGKLFPATPQTPVRPAASKPGDPVAVERGRK